MERSRSSPDIFGILQKRIAALENKRIVDYSLPNWISPTLSGAWTEIGGTEDTVGYWRSSSGIVILKGVVAGGVIPGDLFVLPEGFRPSSLKRFAIISNGAFGYATVNSNGVVRIEVGNNTKVELAGITFRAEQ